MASIANMAFAGIIRAIVICTSICSSICSRVMAYLEVKDLNSIYRINRRDQVFLSKTACSKSLFCSIIPLTSSFCSASSALS
jgi:hypothetical protein